MSCRRIVAGALPDSQLSVTFLRLFGFIWVTKTQITFSFESLLLKTFGLFGFVELNRVSFQFQTTNLGVALFYDSPRPIREEQRNANMINDILSYHFLA